MAKFDYRFLASRAAGRPVVPEYTVVTGGAQNANLTVNDRQGVGIVGEDMLANVIDLTTGTDLLAKFSITGSGTIANTVDATGSGHLLFVTWFKRRPGLG